MDKKWEKQNPLIFLIPGSTFPRLLRIRSKDLEAEITEKLLTHKLVGIKSQSLFDFSIFIHTKNSFLDHRCRIAVKFIKRHLCDHTTDPARYRQNRTYINIDHFRYIKIHSWLQVLTRSLQSRVHQCFRKERKEK